LFPQVEHVELVGQDVEISEGGGICKRFNKLLVRDPLV
jgi:hypothetical protein